VIPFPIFFAIFLTFGGKLSSGDVVMRVDVLLFAIGVLLWALLLTFFQFGVLGLLFGVVGFMILLYEGWKEVEGENEETPEYREH
jgi:pilus assembly protein TadC